MKILLKIKIFSNKQFLSDKLVALNSNFETVVSILYKNV